MIEIEDVVLTDDIKDKYFVCDLNKCKGACCVEGELGAPLEQEECLIIEDILDDIFPYLSDKGKKAIREEGPYILDDEGDFSTTTIEGKECVFAYYEGDVLKCGFEKAFHEEKTSFKKPISCHLYPLRLNSKAEFSLVNYHQWQICDPACKLGKDLRVPLYIFLKDGLTRRFGEEWYEKLVAIIEQNQDLAD